MSTDSRLLIRRLLAALLAGSVLPPCLAEDDSFDDFARFLPGPEWQEQNAVLPAYPRDGNLVEVALDHPEVTYRVFLDRKALSSDEDGVVRYTAVLESPAGARNVIYEGIRCSKGSYKQYAFGGNGAMDPVPDPRWHSLPQYGEGLYRRVLAEYYLCNASRSPLKVRQILGRVSTGGDEFEY